MVSVTTYDKARIDELIQSEVDIVPTTVVNTAAVTDLTRFALPAGKLGRNGDSLRLTVAGNMLNNSGGSINHTFSVLLGASTVLQSTALGLASSAIRRHWRFIIDIARISQNAQVISAEAYFSNATAGSLIPISTNSGFVGHNTATEDLLTALDLALRVQFSSAAATIDMVQTFSRLEHLRAPA